MGMVTEAGAGRAHAPCDRELQLRQLIAEQQRRQQGEPPRDCDANQLLVAVLAVPGKPARSSGGPRPKTAHKKLGIFFPAGATWSLVGQCGLEAIGILRSTGDMQQQQQQKQP